MPPQQGQCPFCQLIGNPDQLITVGETEHFYAWLEVNPRARGHTMIVPKEHKENVLEFSPEEWQEAFELTREVIGKAKKGLEADGASVTVNIEEAGGQMLPHAYIQVFPRFQEDENAGTPTGAIFPQREDLQQQLESIQGEMNSASVDFGDGESHEPHEDSQKFKSAGKIESMLDSPGPSGDGDDEEESKQDEEPEPEEAAPEPQETTGETSSSEVSADPEELSEEELMRSLIDRHGSAENLVNSDDFRALVRKAGYRLRRDRDGQMNSSYNWV